MLLDASPDKAKRIETIQKEISLERNSILQAGGHLDMTTKTSSLNKNWEFLNDIVAGECLYCGEVMINSLDKPFLTLQDVPWD